MSPQHSQDRRSPTVSVVVCAYTERRWPALSAGLELIFAQRPAPLEVIAVIDHNEMLTERLRAAFPHAKVIPNAETRGLSGARNTGVRHARGEVVAFIDDDAFADPGWLAGLTAAYRDPRVAATGGTVAPLWRAPRPPWLPDEFLWIVGCSYRGLPEELTPIRNPIGANMSLRRTLCLEAGGFNSGLGRVGRTPLGCEETELSIRIRRVKSDAVILYVPAASVRHEVVADRLTFSYFVARCWSEGISKAIVSRLVGAEAALASERRYLLRTLPAALWRATREALGGDRHALGRAGTLLVGVGITGLGYLRGSIADIPQGGLRQAEGLVPGEPVSMG